MSRPESPSGASGSVNRVWRPPWASRRRRWSPDVIIRSIQALREAGADLSYTGARGARSNLHRAAVRHFGSWRRALESAGVDPNTVGRRRRWTNALILERIQHLARLGGDLSWTAVVKSPDRAMALAAVRSCHFGSWQEALRRAGVAKNAVTRRIGRWTRWDVVDAIRQRRHESLPLNAKAVEKETPALIAAARRRFGSWTEALRAAGVEPETVVLRKVSVYGQAGGKDRLRE